MLKKDFRTCSEERLPEPYNMRNDGNYINQNRDLCFENENYSLLSLSICLLDGP